MKITARSSSAVAAVCLLLPFAACAGGDVSKADAGRPDIFGADTDDTGGSVEDTAVDSGAGDAEADSVADTDPTDTAADTTTDTDPADTAEDTEPDTTADSGGPPICGNGTIEAGEACDDGNRLAGDGCSFNCTLECGAGNDSDFDGVCNGSDVCPGFDDHLDVDANGIPDGCEGSSEICTDRIDNDLDGATDCADTECSSLSVCTDVPTSETNCADGIDNDLDRYADCLDLDCVGDPACGPADGAGTCAAPRIITGAGTYTGDTTAQADQGRTGCSTGAGGLDDVWSVTVPTTGNWCFIVTEATFDTTLYMTSVCLTTSSLITCDANDGPSTWSMTEAPLTAGRTVFLAVDGNTSSAFGTYRLLVQAGACPLVLPEYCDNGVDDDANGATDCADAACAVSPLCGPQPEVCNDTLDNDLDGLVDCSDTDCFAATVCIPFPEVCNDGLDNDLDTLVDCSDPDCVDALSCIAFPEVCNDGLDNDLDGAIDCDDAQCSDSYCTPTGNGSCTTPTAIGSFGTFTGATSFSNREGSCGGLGYEEAIRWRAPLTGNICVQLAGSATFDAVLYARAVCTSTTELACNDDYSETSYGARIDLAVTNASSYFLFADTFALGDRGTWNLTISRGTCAEVYGSEASCIDGLDNDTDLDIDCADADCATDPACP